MTEPSERRCVRDMIAEIRGHLDTMERDLSCGMSQERFKVLAATADDAIRLMLLCQERFIEKSEGA